jgi:mono/diheme cytochrome c family protein
MNKSKQTWVQTVIAVATVAMLVGGLASTLCSADPTPALTPAQTNSVSIQTNAAVAAPVAVRAPLTGAELYSINCNRCHQERYPTERTGAQWRTIMLHMQVRANIPVSQARLILQYLQDNSGR